MAVCGNCNFENRDGAKFCAKCGSKLDAAEAVEKVPADIAEEAAGAAGAEAAGAEAAGAVEQTAEQAAETAGETAAQASEEAAEAANAAEEKTAGPAPAAAPAKKGSAKKWVVIGALIVLIIAAAAIAIIAGRGQAAKSVKNFGMYVKDGSLFYTEFGKTGASEISPKFITDPGDQDASDIEYAVRNIYGSYTKLSKDGKLLFYPDRNDASDMYSSITLYYRPLAGKNTDPVKIDSNIYVYAVNDDATLVTYIKEGTLYQYDIAKGEKNKIKNDVYDFWVSDDGACVYSVTYDDDLYENGTRAASGVGWICKVSDDCRTLWFMKDDDLYKYVSGGQAEKLISDVYSVEKICDSGVIYYSKSSGDLSLMDYVKDDMKDADAKLTYPEEPDYPDYPYFWNYATQEEYDAAYGQYQEEVRQYEAEYESYLEAWQEYEQKLDRDALRAELKDWTMTPEISLYMFDGSASQLVTDKYSPYSSEFAEDADVAVIQLYDMEKFEPAKLSEITDLYDLDSKIYDVRFESLKAYALKGSSITELDSKPHDMFYIAPDGSTIYMVTDIIEDKYCGDMYAIDMKSGAPAAPAQYDTDVMCYMVEIMDNGSLRYFKDVDYEKGRGDMYIDRQTVDYDVSLYDIRSDKDADTIAYFTDYNDDKEQGTLRVYKNGKAETVSEDVHAFSMTPAGDVMYIYDYSSRRCTGDLFVWRNGAGEKLDTDVTAILPFVDRKYATLDGYY